MSSLFEDFLVLTVPDSSRPDLMHGWMRRYARVPYIHFHYHKRQNVLFYVFANWNSGVLRFYAEEHQIDESRYGDPDVIESIKERFNEDQFDRFVHKLYGDDDSDACVEPSDEDVYADAALIKMELGGRPGIQFNALEQNISLIFGDVERRIYGQHAGSEYKALAFQAVLPAPNLPNSPPPPTESTSSRSTQPKWVVKAPRPRRIATDDDKQRWQEYLTLSLQNRDQFAERLRDERQCPVCLEEFDSLDERNPLSPFVTACGHAYCFECFRLLALGEQTHDNQRTNCVLCRQDLSDQSKWMRLYDLLNPSSVDSTPKADIDAMEASSDLVVGRHARPEINASFRARRAEERTRSDLDDVRRLLRAIRASSLRGYDNYNE